MLPSPLALAFRSAAFRAAADTRFIPDATLHLHAYVDPLRLSFPSVTPTVLPLPAARDSVIDAAFALADRPNHSTLARYLAAVATLSASLLYASDSTPARLMSPTAPGEPRPAPRPIHVPPSELEWQTRPSIGMDPMRVAILREAVQRARDYDNVDSAAERYRDASHAEPRRPKRSRFVH